MKALPHICHAGLPTPTQASAMQRVRVEIAERKRTEAAASAAASLLNAALESTADGILVVDLDGRILRWNQKFANLWQIPAALLASHDDATLLNYVTRQLAQPEVFLDQVRDLYGRPEASSFDQIDLADGRVVEALFPTPDDG